MAYRWTHVEVKQTGRFWWQARPIKVDVPEEGQAYEPLGDGMATTASYGGLTMAQATRRAMRRVRRWNRKDDRERATYKVVEA